MADTAMHLKDDNEKPGLSHHDEDGGLGSRTRSGDEGSIEVAPMQTPGHAWERKTILKIDLRLLIIREHSLFPSVFVSFSLTVATFLAVGLCYAVSLM